MYPKVKEIVNKHKIAFALVEIEDIPMFSGQFSIFTVPAILIFTSGKEVFRQARFLNIYEINKELSNWEKYVSLK